MLYLYIEPASITTPAASLTDRELLVGGGPVMFQCENQGIPAPMVTWYHNGETIQPDSGVRVNSNQVVISEPQVSNSGMYQCVVSNTIDGVVREDRRQWVLEVREPSKYGGRVQPTVQWLGCGFNSSSRLCKNARPNMGLETVLEKDQLHKRTNIYSLSIGPSHSSIFGRWDIAQSAN